MHKQLVGSDSINDNYSIIAVEMLKISNEIRTSWLIF